MNWERLGYYFTIGSVAAVGSLIFCLIALIIILNGTVGYIILSIIESAYYGYKRLLISRFFAYLIAYSLKESDWRKANFGFVSSYVGRGFFAGL